jgi:large subunit ribosomal protein L10
MSKLVKDLITRELAGRYSSTDNAVWVEMVGVEGTVTTNFRRELRGKQMRLEVVKSSLLRRAVADKPLSTLAQRISGPAAIITGGDSPIDVAKLLRSWADRLPTLKVRGALLDGEYLDENRCQELDKMPTRADLQAQIAGMARSPGAKLASAINSPGGAIAGCLKALIEKLETSGAATSA